MSVKDTNRKCSEHNNTEVDTVFKLNKGAIQVNLLPGTTPNADSGKTEADEK